MQPPYATVPQPNTPPASIAAHDTNMHRDGRHKGTNTWARTIVIGC